VIVLAQKEPNLISPGRQPRVKVHPKSREPRRGDTSQAITPEYRPFRALERWENLFLGLTPQANQIPPLRGGSFSWHTL
jgi:hypothetical protein